MDRQLERMNSVHALHNPERFSRLVHFVFSFHDSTFECVADDVEIAVHPLSEPLTLAVELFRDRPGRLTPSACRVEPIGYRGVRPVEQRPIVAFDHPWGGGWAGRSAWTSRQ